MMKQLGWYKLQNWQWSELIKGPTSNLILKIGMHITHTTSSFPNRNFYKKIQFFILLFITPKFDQIHTLQQSLSTFLSLNLAELKVNVKMFFQNETHIIYQTLYRNIVYFHQWNYSLLFCQTSRRLIDHKCITKVLQATFW